MEIDKTFASGLLATNFIGSRKVTTLQSKIRRNSITIFLSAKVKLVNQVLLFTFEKNILIKVYSQIDVTKLFEKKL